jgi:hypothetical protein
MSNILVAAVAMVLTGSFLFCGACFEVFQLACELEAR